MPRRVMTPLLIMTVGLGLASGCKRARTTDAPGRSINGWSLAEIEAELRRNGDQLSDAGIVVARAEPPPAPAMEPEPAPDPAPPEVTAPVDEGAYEEDDEASESLDDNSFGPEPEPEPEMNAPMAADRSPVNRRALVRQRGRLAERRARARERRAAKNSDRCVRICELAESTCDLEIQVCELAERHPDDPRYEQACLNAEMQCDAASSACDRCEG